MYEIRKGRKSEKVGRCKSRKLKKKNVGYQKKIGN